MLPSEEDHNYTTWKIIVIHRGMEERAELFVACMWRLFVKHSGNCLDFCGNLLPSTLLSFLLFFSHVLKSSSTITLEHFWVYLNLICNVHLGSFVTREPLPCQIRCVGPMLRLTLCFWWMAPGVSDVWTSRLFVPSLHVWWASLTSALIGSKSVRWIKISENDKVCLCLLIQQQRFSLRCSNKDLAASLGLAQYSGDPKTEWHLNAHQTRESLLDAVSNLPYKGGNTLTGDSLRFWPFCFCRCKRAFRITLCLLRGRSGFELHPPEQFQRGRRDASQRSKDWRLDHWRKIAGWRHCPLSKLARSGHWALCHR